MTEMTPDQKALREIWLTPKCCDDTEQTWCNFDPGPCDDCGAPSVAYVLLADAQAVRRAAAIVDEQAEDDGLWFVAETAPEAYLQAALRRLHEAVEGKSARACALDALSQPAATAGEGEG